MVISRASSNLHGDPSQLELGLEVEYTVAYKNSANGTCKSAENVRILPKGTIKPDATVEDETVYDGVVVRSMRSVNPDQPEYSGLIRSNSADGKFLFSFSYYFSDSKLLIAFFH